MDSITHIVPQRRLEYVHPADFLPLITGLQKTCTSQWSTIKGSQNLKGFLTILDLADNIGFGLYMSVENYHSRLSRLRDAGTKQGLSKKECVEFLAELRKAVEAEVQHLAMARRKMAEQLSNRLTPWQHLYPRTARQPKDPE